MIDADQERAMDTSAMGSEWSTLDEYESEKGLAGHTPEAGLSAYFVAQARESGLVRVAEELRKQGNFTTLERKIVGGIPASSTISHLASVGTAGEDKRKGAFPAHHSVRIGEGVVIREFCTVNGGFERVTDIGNDCFLMAHSHVGHDCRLGDHVTLCTGAILGGHTIVHDRATLGLNATTHPHVTIGAYAYVGAGSVVTRDVPPFAMVYGVPARQHGFNVEGMRRAGFTAEQIEHVESGGRTPWHDLFDRDRGRHK